MVAAAARLRAARALSMESTCACVAESGTEMIMREYSTSAANGGFGAVGIPSRGAV
jgi:hypothetical protein